jgi:hypothetical protein
MVSLTPQRLSPYQLGHRMSIGFTGTGMFVTVIATGALLVLHVLPNHGGVNPVYGMLSDYALVPDAWIFKWGLLGLSIGSFFMWGPLIRNHILTGKLANVLMAVWILGIAGIALVAKDRTEVHETIHGGVHLWFTVVACSSLPAIQLWLAYKHWKNSAWKVYPRVALALALVNLPCLAPFVIAFMLNRFTDSERYSGVATGLVERVMGLFDVASLILLGVWALYACGVPRSSAKSAERHKPFPN